MALKKITEGQSGAQASQDIFDNDTFVDARVTALDNKTKPAQDIIYLTQDSGKWGVLDKDFNILLMIDANDNIDAAGVSARLAAAIGPSVAPFALAAAGIVQLTNGDYIWGILDMNLGILLAVKENGTVVGEFEGFAAVKDKLDKAVSNKIVFIGDSLTQAVTYPNVFTALAGPSYIGVNQGVGGETVPSICARMGGVPAVFTQAFTLPADGSAIEISSLPNIRLKNYKYGADVKPLMQNVSTRINPCYVQGIECTLAWTGSGSSDPDGVWTIRRNTPASAPFNVVANTPLYTSAAYDNRKCAMVLYWMGQNIGYDTPEQLVAYLRASIEFNGNPNYLVLGLHTGTPASRAALEDLMLKEFGLRYLNLRVYISTYALADAGITPTTADLAAMAAGTFPPSFWNTSTDSTHMNVAGYTQVGRKAFQLMTELGTFK